MKFSLESDTKLRTYFVRIVWELEGCPGLVMNGRTGRRLSKHSAVTSLPMFAKYARININDLPMQKLLIKMKDPFNLKHIKILKDELVFNLDS